MSKELGGPQKWITVDGRIVDIPEPGSIEMEDVNLELFTENRHAPENVILGTRQLEVREAALRENYDLYRTELLDLAQSICFLDYVHLLAELSVLLPIGIGLFVSDNAVEPPPNPKLVRSYDLLEDYVDFNKPPYDGDIIERAFDKIAVAMYQYAVQYQAGLADRKWHELVSSERTVFARDPDAFLVSLTTLLVKYADSASRLITRTSESIGENTELMISFHGDEPRELFTARDKNGVALHMTDNLDDVDIILEAYGKESTPIELSMGYNSPLLAIADTEAGVEDLPVVSPMVIEHGTEISGEIVSQEILSQSQPPTETTQVGTVVVTETTQPRGPAILRHSRIPRARVETYTTETLEENIPVLPPVPVIEEGAFELKDEPDTYHHQIVTHAKVVPALTITSRVAAARSTTFMINMTCSFTTEVYLIENSAFMSIQKQIIRNSKSMTPIGVNQIKHSACMRMSYAREADRFFVEFRLKQSEGGDYQFFNTFMGHAAGMLKRMRVGTGVTGLGEETYMYELEKPVVVAFIWNLLQLVEPPGFSIVFNFTIPHSQSTVPYDTKILRIIQKVYPAGYKMWAARKMFGYLGFDSHDISCFILMCQRNKLLKYMMRTADSESENEGYTNKAFSILDDVEERLLTLKLLSFYKPLLVAYENSAAMRGYITKGKEVVISQAIASEGDVDKLAKILSDATEIYGSIVQETGRHTSSDITKKLTTCRMFFASNVILNLAYRGSFEYIVTTTLDYKAKLANSGTEISAIFQQMPGISLRFEKAIDGWTITRCEFLNQASTNAIRELDSVISSLKASHALIYGERKTIDMRSNKIILQSYTVSGDEIEAIVRDLVLYRIKDRNLKAMVAYGGVRNESGVGKMHVYSNITTNTYAKGCEFYGASIMKIMSCPYVGMKGDVIVHYCGISELLTNTYNTAVLTYIKGKLMSDMYLSNIYTKELDPKLNVKDRVNKVMAFFDQIWSIPAYVTADFKKVNLDAPHVINLDIPQTYDMVKYLAYIGCISQEILQRYNEENEEVVEVEGGSIPRRRRRS